MKQIALFLLLILLSACAARAPSPDYSTGGKTEAPAVRNPAVVALLAEAQRQREAGNHPLAASALERALRISPRDAALRLELGRLRLEQGDPFQAKELARMAVVYAGEQHAVEADAWDLIAAAEEAIGNPMEATLARQEAARLRDE